MRAYADIVGAGFARPGGKTDAVGGVVPGVVASPGSEEEVARLLAVPTDAGVLAVGLRGHVETGAPPRALGLLVALDRLDRVVEHSAADMTVVVQAGCPLSCLQETLATAGQWLPIDPPRAAHTTVGGLVAANLWGPLRSSQGSVRDLMLGVRVVDGRGIVIRGGGRVVKNVAGYDLPKLHVGAFGQLGIVTEVVFRVRPKPPVEDALVVPCREAAEAIELALALHDRIESGWLVARVTTGQQPDVAVGFLGLADEVRDARARVLDFAPAARRPPRPAPGFREELSDFATQWACPVLRVSVLPSDLGDVVTRLDPSASAVVHVATGVVKVALPAKVPLAAELARLRALALRLGGTVVVERSPVGLESAVDVWGELGPGIGLMRRVKDALDPAGRLAPGRLL